MSEKYVNYYIETLTSTMTDAVVRNISLQTNNRISDEVIKDLTNKNESLINSLNDLKESTIKNENQVINSLKTQVEQNQQRINELTSENALLNKMRNDFESIKSKANSADNFRNELVKERESHKNTIEKYEEQIARLTLEIQSLKSPKKTKKAVKSPEVSVTQEQEKIVSPDAIKDGGSF